MEYKDISTEEWREYIYGDQLVRIAEPQRLYVGTTTHRVVTSDGVAWCLPAPGYHGCYIRWKNKDTTVPVNF